MSAVAKRELLEVPGGLVEASDTVCSNFDHEIDEAVVKELETGNCFAKYPGWNFHAMVWYDKESGQFIASVRRDHALVANYFGTTFRAVKEQICEAYGND